MNFFDTEGDTEVNNEKYTVHKLTKPISKMIKTHFQKGFFITKDHIVVAVGEFVTRDERVEIRLTSPDKEEWFYGNNIEEALGKVLLK